MPDVCLDRDLPRTHFHKYDDLIIGFMNEVNLIEYWRLINLDVEQYTWFNMAGNGQRSRLDYWLISTTLVGSFTKCGISASPITDHYVVTLSLTPFRNELCLEIS